MKRILNINTFLVLVVLFILFNIFASQYAKIADYFRERSIYKQCIIVKFGSNYALVRDKKVLIDSNNSAKPYIKDNTIMISLNFFLKSLKEKYIYNDNNGNIIIIYDNKKLQLSDNLEVHITVSKNNRAFEYNCPHGEYANSAVYLPLNVLAEFFDKTVFKRGNITVISDSNNLGDIDLEKLDEMLSVKN